MSKLILILVFAALGAYFLRAIGSAWFTGEIKECSEGVLRWVKKEDIKNLPIWEGDKLFFDLLEKANFFTMILEYRGDTLVRHEEKIYW